MNRVFILKTFGNKMSIEILDIASKFKIPGKAISWKPIGKGHIHKTYVIKTGKEDLEQFILQKVNTKIFPETIELNNNIASVTRHSSSPLQMIQAYDGRFYYSSDNGDFWRMFNYIPESLTIDNTSDPDIAFEAGKAIAGFQKDLNDFTGKIHIILPEFHKLERRQRELSEAIKNNLSGKLENAEDLVQQYDNFSSIMKDYENRLTKTGIPFRITHNDTKLNNILFNKSGKAICMIDLDTVMPGYVAYDYGDALRTLANNAPEDATNIDNVSFNMKLCNAFTKGYLTEARSFLTKQEQRLLPEAPAFMTYLIGIRFLADYLNGDVYYQISHQEQNLDRARTQMALLDQIFQKKEAIQQLF
mgnify:CR=1 FL=1